VPSTHFNEETGSFVLRRLDGMVNGYCPPLSKACCCNSDIKFMTSGDAAKSVLFYITDYISKMQEKSHVSFGALEAALKKLGDYNPTDTDPETRGKQTLQKCAYVIMSHQELSGQQVAAYLRGYGDHYSSHAYQNLYWTAFERSIDTDAPSPKCYKKERSPADGFGECAMSDPCTDGSGLARTSGTTDQEDDSTTDDTDTLAEPDDEQTEDRETPTTPDDEQTEDVIIMATADGSVVQCSTQVHDYCFRAPAPSHLSVWDFVSRVDKVAKSGSQDESVDEVSDNDCMGDNSRNDAENSGHDEDPEDTDHYEQKSTPKRGRKCQTFPLHLDHTQNQRKVHRLWSNPTKYYIPVPIGPALPHWDREHQYARYCRLMLILFKPWRVADDLRDDGQTWPSAFKVFLETCNDITKCILDNMQVMHKCKDVKDMEDQCQRSTYHQSNHSQWSAHNETEQFGGDVIEDDLLDHLDSVVNYASDRRVKSNADILECLNELQKSGILLPPTDAHQSGLNLSHSTDELMLPQWIELEDMWKTAYANRKDMWKRKLCKPSSPPLATELQLNPPTVSSFADASEASVVNIMHPVCPASVSVNEIILKWMLNTEQAHAFSLIATHSQQKPENSEPLRMYLGGPGGMGKSRVIAALTDYFVLNGEPRRLRLALFTGVAAKNINGTTMHTALALNQHKKKGKSGNGKTKTDLITMWMGVDYLFVDEVSMIGCNLLLQIHEVLVDAKGCTEPFGGINVIFAGDFAQLPPVGQTKLFSRVKLSKEPIIFGQLLWRSITTVVMLTEQMRQAGPENQPFVEMLSRLRDGRCLGEDYDCQGRLSSHL
jgi:hypothetical protein